MKITRNSLDTAPGPHDWFTGAVFIDTIASPSPPSRVGAASVHFTPGARTAWHTHPFGQTIYVTEGLGLCQRRGGPVEVIRPGDRVYFEPDEEHWHGASATRFMTHIAIQEADDSGTPVAWGEHVTDEEYTQAPLTEVTPTQTLTKKAHSAALGLEVRPVGGGGPWIENFAGYSCSPGGSSRLGFRHRRIGTRVRSNVVKESQG